MNEEDKEYVFMITVYLIVVAIMLFCELTGVR